MTLTFKTAGLTLLMMTACCQISEAGFFSAMEQTHTAPPFPYKVQGIVDALARPETHSRVERRDDWGAVLVVFPPHNAPQNMPDLMSSLKECVKDAHGIDSGCEIIFTSLDDGATGLFDFVASLLAQGTFLLTDDPQEDIRLFEDNRLKIVTLGYPANGDVLAHTQVVASLGEENVFHLFPHTSSTIQTDLKGFHVSWGISSDASKLDPTSTLRALERTQSRFLSGISNPGNLLMAELPSFLKRIMS